MAIQGFEGNRAEVKTILPVLAGFRERHDLKNITVTADAAMLSAGNIFLAIHGEERAVNHELVSEARRRAGSFVRFDAGRIGIAKEEEAAENCADVRAA